MLRCVFANAPETESGGKRVRACRREDRRPEPSRPGPAVQTFERSRFTRQEEFATVPVSSAPFAAFKPFKTCHINFAAHRTVFHPERDTWRNTSGAHGHGHRSTRWSQESSAHAMVTGVGPRDGHGRCRSPRGLCHRAGTRRAPQPPWRVCSGCAGAARSSLSSPGPALSAATGRGRSCRWPDLGRVLSGVLHDTQ